MKRHLSGALAAALILFGGHARAEAGRAPSPHTTCTGIYSGSARGIFKCRVVAVHRPTTNRAIVTLELADEIQLTGDALTATLGGLEWTGEVAPGTRAIRDASVVSGWSYLQTGLPPTPADYVAARASPKYAVEQGDISITVTSVVPGAPGADGSRSYEVHGSFSARLMPYPAGNAVGVGVVKITASF